MGYRLGTAYAVVKVALPVRMAVSIAGAPWFARWAVEPLRDAGIRILKGLRKP
jgi:hypothetical protein